jgi:peptide-methionine (S)-S-oxide reductase
MEKATFGGGCFWGIEAAFSRIPGVVSATSGYMGGKTENPSYSQVCSDTTGHAEVVQVEFDPEKVSYEKLLEAFFQMHDPTQVNRQGPDVGSQYRSIIFYHTPEQEQTINQTFQRLQESKKFSRPIATEVAPAPTFWPAEEYHQKYLERRGLASCHI